MRAGRKPALTIGVAGLQSVRQKNMKSARSGGDHGRGSGAGPRILLTMGDPCGIGPEIVLKAAAAADVSLVSRLRVVGSRDAMEYWASFLGLSLDVDIVDLGMDPCPVTPGRSSVGGARAAAEAVARAARLCGSGEADAMVTSPVSKAAIQKAGYDFTGHTEFLARLTGAHGFIMTFVRGGERVGLVTTHLPLREVAEAITIDLVAEKARILSDGLRDFLGVGDARIAVAGLNPHAGEEGWLGDEEELLIAPAIARAREMGVRAEGPFPADTVYSRFRYAGGATAADGFDAVLAMYHDQATIAVKRRGSARSVNVTLGLPIVRTSVDHGTAFGIAGKGSADPSSMAAAIELAAEIARRRKGRVGKRVDEEPARG